MDLRIAESEYRFMQVVWDNAPVGSGQLVELCAEKLNWKKSTTYTVLKKMCVKGLLENKKSMITLLVPREEVDRYAAERFVDRVFAGSLPGFLATYLGDKTLSAAQLEELKAILDARK